MLRATLVVLITALVVSLAGNARAQGHGATSAGTTSAGTTSAGTTSAGTTSAGTTSTTGSGRPGEEPAPAALTPEDIERRSHAIARIGTVSITVGEVEDQIGRQSPFMRARFRDPAQLRELVDNMIRFELLAREADRQGFGSDPEVREATSQSAVQQLVRERFDQVITPESIPAEDVRAYYDAHPEEFTRSEVRRASHILLGTRERANELLAQARAADARAFRQIAQEHSLDAESRARGGDLRYFDAEGRSTNSADPAVSTPLVTAAFALDEVGDVSAPIEVEGQWSIVKLTGRRPAEHRSIEEAGPSIRLRLWRERRQGAIDSFVEGLRTRGSVEAFYDRMRPIHMEPPERTSEDDPHGAPEGDEEDSLDPLRAIDPTGAPVHAGEPGAGEPGSPPTE